MFVTCLWQSSTSHSWLWSRGCRRLVSPGTAFFQSHASWTGSASHVTLVAAALGFSRLPEMEPWLSYMHVQPPSAGELAPHDQLFAYFYKRKHWEHKLKLSVWGGVKRNIARHIRIEMRMLWILFCIKFSEPCNPFYIIHTNLNEKVNPQIANKFYCPYIQMNSLIMKINIIPSDFWAHYSGYTCFIILQFQKKNSNWQRNL